MGPGINAANGAIRTSITSGGRTFAVGTDIGHSRKDLQSHVSERRLYLVHQGLELAGRQSFAATSMNLSSAG